MDDNDDFTVREVDLEDLGTLKIKEFTLLQDEAGAVVWDAGLVLSYYLAYQHLKGRPLVAGRTCLELGSGTGVVGLTASRLGAVQVYLTDLPHLVPYMRENIQLNGLGARCRALPLEWCNPQHLAAARSAELLGRGPERILAADVLYDKTGRHSFFRTLAELMTPCGSIVTDRSNDGSSRDAGASGHCEEKLQSTGDGGGGGAGGGGGGVMGAAERCGGESGGGTDYGLSHSGGRVGGGGDGNGDDNSGGGGAADDGGGDDNGSGSGGSSWEGDDGVVAFLSYEQRPGVEEVPELCAQNDLMMEEVPMGDLHPSWRSADIRILRLWRGSPGALQSG
ncbi:hypothetical protein Vretimale_14989 [Volvox reticuliferus]|uniref:Uncharacterized protein n=1 Tax=Volvox reticuliferus TaxID=1737510 RepID=A0A8J4CTG9_9CHLO|nr:hypothetical protein Vretifemale_16390 [Volvox reticuliferus]GIM11514.1 hypothetical protein Vretimale_14989 [Volvox reticuliferus]